LSGRRRRSPPWLDSLLVGDSLCSLPGFTVQFRLPDAGVEIGARAEQVVFPWQHPRFDRDRRVRAVAVTGRRKSLGRAGQEELLLPA
jgi:hypothetical protein